jgi:hypothetical protein
VEKRFGGWKRTFETEARKAVLNVMIKNLVLCL